MKKIVLPLLVTALVMATPTVAFADSVSVDFEPTTYALGNINGQDGWSKTGPFDSMVASNTYGFPSFATQSLRISNAITSGSFGDQTFAKPLTDAVGETTATSGSFATGARQTHFEVEYDLVTALPTYQPGLSLSFAPDRGDGSRMSYLRFEDSATDINVFFDDVSGTTSPVSFDETQIGTNLSRSMPHRIKMTMDVVEGPSNDIVKVWIDGTQVMTGTSWENYYRYDNEASAEQSPRMVKTAIFRTAGAAALANSGKGFLIDNLSMSSSTPLAGKDSCKNGGWQSSVNPTFKNQGACVSYFQSNEKAGKRN